jgi:hypothetical protein
MIKAKMIIITGTVMAMMAMSANAFADVYVNSYSKKNGTTVDGHYRTDPGNSSSNYSNKGNINPYTGKKGSKKIFLISLDEDDLLGLTW